MQEYQVEFLNAGVGSGMPYSEVVRVGHLLFLSGKMGTDTSGKIVPGGITAETRQALEKIKKTLERYGSSLDRVVKVTVMLTDMSEWADMNAVYVNYFSKNLPARSTFGVNGLARNGRVEIECIAVMS